MANRVSSRYAAVVAPTVKVVVVPWLREKFSPYLTPIEWLSRDPDDLVLEARAHVHADLPIPVDLGRDRVRRRVGSRISRDGLAGAARVAAAQVVLDVIEQVEVGRRRV